MIYVAILTNLAVSKLLIMTVGDNVKRLREDRGVKQQEIADLIGMHRSNYSKIESGQREISVAALDKVANFFGITVDTLIHMESKIPKEVQIEDKTTAEQIRYIQQLEEEDRSMVFKMIDTFLTKKKMKDFFENNVASL